MAIFKPSHLVQAISGSLGSLTFKLTKRGPVISRRRPSSKSPSPAQQASSSRFSTLAAEWANLTPAQRLAWNAFGHSLPQQDTLHIPRIRSGRNWFIHHNSFAYLAGAAIITDPPAETVAQPAIAFSLAYSVIDYYWLELDPPTQFSNTYYFLEISRAYRPFDWPLPKNSPPVPSSYFKNWRICRIRYITSGHLHGNLKGYIVPIIGHITEGELVQSRIRFWHPGAIVSPWSFSTDVCQP